MATFFETCAAEFGDNVTALVGCVSDLHQEKDKSISGGLDAFFLIFAGAMVLYVSFYLCGSSLRLLYFIVAVCVGWLPLVVGSFVVRCCARLLWQCGSSFLCGRHHFFSLCSCRRLLCDPHTYARAVLCKPALPCFAPDRSVPRMFATVRTIVRLLVGLSVLVPR